MTFKEHMTDDLPVFFNDTEFGAIAIYGGESFNVQKFIEASDFGDNTYTRMVGRVIDFIGVVKDDIIVIDSTTYAVISSRIDEMNNIIEVFLNE